MTHLVEVAGLILQVPFIRFLIALVIVTIAWDALTDRRVA